MIENRVGIVGLARMGGPMARNLLHKGFQVAGYDLHGARVSDLVPHGLIACASPAEASRKAAFVITMVPADADVRDAMLGPRGVHEQVSSGCLWLQMSTIKASTVQDISRILAPRGVRTVDCPVSRGGRVVQGELSVFAGGDAADLDRARGVLGAMATDIVHCGPLGMGQAAKIVNNMLSMVNVAMTAEALVLGLKSGLDPHVLYAVVNAGNGASVAWRDRSPQMTRREFEPEVRVPADMAFKDLSLAIEAAHECGSPALISAVAREAYGALKAAGRGHLHYAAVVTVFERLAGIEAFRENQRVNAPGAEDRAGTSRAQEPL